MVEQVRRAAGRGMREARGEKAGAQRRGEGAGGASPWGCGPSRWRWRRGWQWWWQRRRESGSGEGGCCSRAAGGRRRRAAGGGGRRR